MYFNKCLKQNPEYFDAYVMKGNMYEADENFEKAL